MSEQSLKEQTILRLEKSLDSFDPAIRSQSLRTLAAMADTGEIETAPPREMANLHCHSFYSYNGYGYSPSHLAWIGRKHGIKLMGIVDFDVLEGVDEFLSACQTAGVRGTAGIETRVFIPQFEHAEINSPGEPGVAYHMGSGFANGYVPAPAAALLTNIRQRAVDRNQHILQTLNHFLSPLKLDYENDILPLTPAGYATERHIVQKIAQKAAETFDEPASFWAKKLTLPVKAIQQQMQNPNDFKGLLRQRLMKRGGVAYVQPGQESFPAVNEFHQIVLTAGAIPCAAWLDGTSDGEQDMPRLLGLLVEQGVAALNIIPNRNWDIQDPHIKATKLNLLYEVVDLAEKLALPILAGTEMNRFGQKLVDSFDAPELAPIRAAFMKGAYFLYGHTTLARLWGLGYQSEWAKTHLPKRADKNIFYEQAGRLVSPALIKALTCDFQPQTVRPTDILSTLMARDKD